MKLPETFDKISQEYDLHRKKLIPCFDDLYGVAISNLDLSKENPVILDLGAGTGLFSKMVFQKYSSAKIHLVDVAEKMLEVARQRFNGNSNISFECLDYVNFSPQVKYDAVISSLSIHHLTDNNKIKLYSNIYQWLKPGGIFINADQVLADTTYFEELYSKQWKHLVESTDLDMETIKAAYERVKLDKRSPLLSQLNWLKETGFKYIDCLYKFYDFVVLWAKK